MVAKKVRESFSKVTNGAQLNLAKLQRQFGESILIEPKEGLESVEVIDDITLKGFSRGAVTTFATARALDDLDTPISILANDPVPGDSRVRSDEADSLYSKNFDLSGYGNIVRGEVLLGSYSKHHNALENKWFRQMAPKFPPTADSHIYLVNKEHHCEFNRIQTTYNSSFLYHRGLTDHRLAWDPLKDKAFVIPKVEQQKFHYGVVGRTEYLPSFKQSVLNQLQSKYDEQRPCPINEESRFKFVQALLVLHKASIFKEALDILTPTVLQDTNKGKGLREFIIEFDSIVQYSKTKDTLTEAHLNKIATIEQSLYQNIADFQGIESPTRDQQEAFTESMHATIKCAKADLPSKVYTKLAELTTLLLNENTLTHPHLVQFINENETSAANPLLASEPAYDGVITNAKELARKLFHSSINQRAQVFDQEKNALPRLIAHATDLIAIASFLPPKKLNEALALVKDRVKSMSDLLSIMTVLPTYKQQKILFHTYKDRIVDMKPSFVELICLMDYLSDIKCKELCKLITITTLADFDLSHPEAAKLSSSKMTLLKGELKKVPAEAAKIGTSHQPVNQASNPVTVYRVALAEIIHQTAAEVLDSESPAPAHH
ncbi:MAG: hypothetical protein ACRC0B_07995 [Legionella sp.]